MLQSDDLFSLGEGEDTAALLRSLPEIRHNLGFHRPDDELGLRSLLDWREPRPPSRTPPSSWTPEAA